ncbi:14082_t:CDS:1 [Racocetra persica]|uniref:14082_t:CDS:1 n=1 Tax=Racocetra persica TaxID=160502 RepID=A0ACA9NKF5_9GLOM|nr:14082_t:CDS:1 [Racocetra persica]
MKKGANSTKQEIDNKEEQVINKMSGEVEIDEIERKNVKVSSVNNDERDDKKSEDLPEQNYEANDSENCHRNGISNSRFGEKCETTIKVRNMSMDQLNQVYMLIRILKAVDYVEGFIRISEDTKARMLRP